jgi:hypothetical protein
MKRQVKLQLIIIVYCRFNENSAARWLSVRLSRGTHQLSMVMSIFAMVDGTDYFAQVISNEHKP